MSASTIAGTILVVDECEALGRLIETVLCRAGYRVLRAANGGEALEIARGMGKLDLLLSAAEMREMRGDELVVRIGAVHPSAHCVFLANANGPVELSPPFESLAKPFSITELRRTVERALETGPPMEMASAA
jgi:CheY-like chemotaxis protein